MDQRHCAARLFADGWARSTRTARRSRSSCPRNECADAGTHHVAPGNDAQPLVRQWEREDGAAAREANGKATREDAPTVSSAKHWYPSSVDQKKIRWVLCRIGVPGVGGAFRWSRPENGR